jgi:hypothetical protein
MRVAVMQIRIVRMAVHETGMMVSVRMRLAAWIIGLVCMQMMLVMNVPVLVFHLLMRMFVFVPL